MSFSDAELERYARHLLLDELDLAGQERLRGAHVAVVGLGGLGCPAALYLTTSGVGSISLWDDDVVELANLQRQVLFEEADLGAPKVAAAAARLAKANPHVKLDPRQERVDEGNVAAVIAKADLVLDASDNFATRYLVNRACQEAGVDLVGGAAERFDGHVYVLAFATSPRPCLNCLYPQDKASPPATPCAQLGVFAPLTGVIGSMMASAGVGLLAKLGDRRPQAHLLTYDAIASRVNRIKLSEAGGCGHCADA